MMARPAITTLLCILCLMYAQELTWAQVLSQPPITDKADALENPSAQSISKERALIEEVYEPELIMRIDAAQTKIIKTKHPIRRSVISHPAIVDIQTFNATELEIIGKKVGETTITLWFDIPGRGTQVLRYFVQVDNARQEQRRREARYRELQSRMNELFPNSQVFLIPIEDKVIVKGQASSSQEASQIMQLLGRRESTDRSADWLMARLNQQQAGANADSDSDGLDDFDSLDADHFINLLRVAGEQQVMLKVRVAELVRDSSRAKGTDISAILKSFEVSHSISGGGNLAAILSDGDVKFFLQAVTSHGYGKILAEPTLVAISGKTAEFLAGGEFAVPTTVGVDGVSAASTTFRGFGTELRFTPTVLDKDLIRLQVAPSFSTLNSDATVGGIPGLNRRRVETTVDLREGQWLAIAGLIQDEQGGQRSQLPYIGNLPVLGSLLGRQNTSRFETELIILVSPELVHPLENEQVPLLLPGMEVTDPTNDDFFLRNTIEGYQGFDHRSTVWPEVERQTAGINEHRTMLKLRHGIRRQMNVQSVYVSGPSGLSQ